MKFSPTNNSRVPHGEAAPLLITTISMSVENFERQPAQIRSAIARAYKELQPGQRRHIGNVDALVSMEDGRLLPNFPLLKGRHTEGPVNLPSTSQLTDTSLVVRCSSSGRITLAFSLHREGSDRKIGRSFHVTEKGLISTRRYSRDRTSLTLLMVNETGDELQQEGLHPDEVCPRLIAERLGVPWTHVTRHARSPWVTITPGRLEKAIQSLQRSSGQNPSAREVAKQLGVTTGAVVNSILHRRLEGENLLWGNLGMRRECPGQISRKREWIESLLQAAKDPEMKLLLLAAGFKLLGEGRLKPLQMHFFGQAVLRGTANIEKVDQPIAQRLSVSRNSRLRAWFGERSDPRDVKGFAEQIDSRLARGIRSDEKRNPASGKFARFNQVFGMALRSYVRDHLYTIATEEIYPPTSLHQAIAARLRDLPASGNFDEQGLSNRQRSALNYIICQRRAFPDRKVSHAEVARVLNVKEESITRILSGTPEAPGAFGKVLAHVDGQAPRVNDLFNRLRRAASIDTAELEWLGGVIDAVPSSRPVYSCSDERKNILLVRLARRAAGLGVEPDEVAAALGIRKQKLWSLLSKQTGKYDLAQIADGFLASEVDSSEELIDKVIEEVRSQHFSYSHWVPKIFRYVEEADHSRTLIDLPVSIGAALPEARFIDINPRGGRGPNRFLTGPEITTFFSTYFMGAYSNFGQFQEQLAAALSMPELKTNSRQYFWLLFRGKKGVPIDRPGLVERISDEIESNPKLKAALSEGGITQRTGAAAHYRDFHVDAFHAAQQLLACEPLSDESFAIIDRFWKPPKAKN